MAITTITPTPSSVGDTVAVATVADTDIVYASGETPFDNGDWTTEIAGAGSTITYLQGSIRVNSPSSISAVHQGNIVLDRDSVLTANAFWQGGTDYSWFSLLRDDDGTELVQVLSYFATSYEYNIGLNSGGVVNLFPLGIPQQAGDKFEARVYFDATKIYMDLVIKRANDSTVFNGTRSEIFTDASLVGTHPEFFVSTSDCTLTYYKIENRVLPWSLEKDSAEYDSGTTTGGILSVEVIASLLLDGSLWQYFIDGVGTNIVTMLVNEPPSGGGIDLVDSGTIGAVGIAFTVELPIKYTLSLELIKSELANQAIKWRDLGATFDTFSTKFDRIVTNDEQAQLIQTGLKTPGKVYLNTPGTLYPFTPLFDYPGPVRLILDRSSISSFADERGAVNRFAFAFGPESRDIYSELTILTGSLTPCYSARTSWSLGGVPLPYPDDKFTPVQNEPQNGRPTHGSYSAADRPTVEYLEETVFKVSVDTEAARLLLNMIRTVRLSDMEMIIPANHIPFGQAYKDFNVIGSDLVSLAVGLSINKIEIEYNRADNFIFSLRLQLRGV